MHLRNHEDFLKNETQIFYSGGFYPGGFVLGVLSGGFVGGYMSGGFLS